MYSLEKREGIAVATLAAELMVPTKKSDLEYVVQTINTLLLIQLMKFIVFVNLKNHAVKLAEEVKANLEASFDTSNHWQLLVKLLQ